MDDLKGKLVRACGFHAPAPGEIETLGDTLIDIARDGVIRDVVRSDEARYDRVMNEARRAARLVELPKGRFLLPGLVDLHIHAPQYPQVGNALDVPLEDWLQTYTFPIEARYADAAFARRSYSLLVEDLLASGTTTAMYYGTIHDEANRLLADICIERGQRALIGKVAMDHPDQCPDYYRDKNAKAAIAGTQSLIDHIRSHPDNVDGRVLPVVTPRFIPSCTDALLEDLGALAADHGCHIQTHCSESDWEHAFVKARFGASDAESLDRFGLLRERTVLGHGNFLSAADMDRIRARRAAVAHCPLSNAYFSGAVFPLKDALQKGLRVGLGTDISAGATVSLFDSARSAITASRMLETGTDPDLDPDSRSRHGGARIDFRDAFHLATAGGGAALGLPVGLFRPGFQFDAILIDPDAPLGSIRLWPELHDGEQILQKIIFTAARANIEQVWVGGAACAGTSFDRRAD
ncbi:guanine deaminase [Breoghania corrubedonensis]|uniref:Guanine deaminase n=1 Tax=Breoghania corrubedonensis TaxID=665038 RepID=A0A2T5VGK6_9HYPH|nr:guanine deaminase [Breoghania corrubedonensis]PTW62892.1 guanine deaminase [Breoghania corrubedonensis]